MDRILSVGGYDPENVRLVCIAVNFGMGQWGQELYLTFARAAVEFECSTGALPQKAVVGDPLNAASSNVDTRDDWEARQHERISAAQAVAATLTGDALQRQNRHLASLRRAMTLGPAGLREAASNAWRTRGKPA
jgi:hypothetical protein